MLNKFFIVLLMCVMGLFLFQHPQTQPSIENTDSKHEFVMPVAWLEKRDEELEFWLQN